LRSLCLAVTLAMAATAIGSAQDFNHRGKNELAGTFGRTFVSDQSVPNSGLANSIINHGAGFSFEVNYARILRRSDWADLAIELPVILNPDKTCITSRIKFRRATAPSSSHRQRESGFFPKLRSRRG